MAGYPDFTNPEVGVGEGCPHSANPQGAGRFHDWGVHRFCLFLKGAARQYTLPLVMFSE